MIDWIFRMCNSLCDIRTNVDIYVSNLCVGKLISQKVCDRLWVYLCPTIFWNSLTKSIWAPSPIRIVPQNFYPNEYNRSLKSLQQVLKNYAEFQPFNLIESALSPACPQRRLKGCFCLFEDYLTFSIITLFDANYESNLTIN